MSSPSRGDRRWCTARDAKLIANTVVTPKRVLINSGEGSSDRMRFDDASGSETMTFFRCENMDNPGMFPKISFAPASVLEARVPDLAVHGKDVLLGVFSHRRRQTRYLQSSPVHCGIGPHAAYLCMLQCVGIWSEEFL